MIDYLLGLNEPQREAVLHKDGPIMIIAGAGSGKTKVLTTRIAHLMAEHKVDAFNILALTFTNKAAKEMKERVERTLAIQKPAIFISAHFIAYLPVYCGLKRTAWAIPTILPFTIPMMQKAW